MNYGHAVRLGLQANSSSCPVYSSHVNQLDLSHVHLESDPVVVSRASLSTWTYEHSRFWVSMYGFDFILAEMESGRDRMPIYKFTSATFREKSHDKLGSRVVPFCPQFGQMYGIRDRQFIHFVYDSESKPLPSIDIFRACSCFTPEGESVLGFDFLDQYSRFVSSYESVPRVLSKADARIFLDDGWDHWDPENPDDAYYLRY